jgi:signal transduction histidine kinase
VEGEENAGEDGAANPAAPLRKPRGPRRSVGVFRSAGARFAIVYAVLLAVSAVALASFLWWATAGLLDRQTEAAIRADAQGLYERWTEGFLPSLIMTIDERLNENVDDDAIYIVADDHYHKLAGNLPYWPAVVTQPDTPYPLELLRAGAKSVARVEAFNLPGGFHLLVGRDVRVRSQLRAMLTDALLWALVVVTVMGIAGAAVVRSMFRRTLAHVSDTSAAIAAGDFSRRVPLAGRGDEFDLMAETINVMLDRIETLMDGVRQVSNAIAHDLRTPITRARARLEDAALHARSDAELHAAIERATADLDGIVAVFHALLRIAEIEAGSRRSAFCSFDAVPVLADLIELYGAAAEEKGVRLTVEAPPRLPLYGDREMIQQAVANLLDNALKFSPPDTAVRVQAGASGPWAEISVTDAGPGIPEAERARAVERFYRGESSRNTPGAGLGLALVQAVATLHGGELVLSDARPGLVATVRLARDGGGAVAQPVAGGVRAEEAQPGVVLPE